MAEPIPTEEQAELYVLDELSPRERAAFEKSATESSVVAGSIRELEEGAIALTTTAPIKTAPQFVWTKIEDTIAEEAKTSKIISIFFGAIRNGWAAAAVVLIGWMIHALYMNHRPQGEKVLVATTETIPSTPHVSLVANDLASNASPQRNRETTILSNQLVGLQRQVLQLSQSVTQQQSLLHDASRIKFHNLMPANPSQNTAGRRLSPALQRALFLAMARELGWLPSTNVSTNPKGAETMDVEFVDFRSEQEKSNSLRQEQEKQAEPKTQPKEFAAATSESPLPAVIPAFVSGESLVMAIDNSIVPAGSQVSLLSPNAVVFGSFLLGENPVVITVSSDAFPDGISLQTTGPAGELNVIELNLIGPP